MSDVVARFQAKLNITADGIVGPQTVKAAREYFGVNGYAIAHFFAQCHHETQGFARFEENLNYTTPEQVWRVFRRFDTDGDRQPDPAEIEQARAYIRRPEALANAVYGGRYGNSRPGDGWLYRARGCMGLTFADNYRAFAASAPAFASAFDYPEMVAGEFALDSAAWYFDARGVWDLARQGVRDEITNAVRRKVNGGTNGLEETRRLTKQYFNWIK